MVLGRLPTDRARIIGKPGASTQALTRTALIRRYRALPLGYVLVSFGLVGLLVGSVSASRDVGSVNVTLVALAALAAADQVVRKPSAAATVIVLVVFAMFSPPLTALYALAANPLALYFSTSNTTMLCAALLVAFLAHRTSRGRPWVTTALALAAVTFAGPFLLLALPLSAGFFAAYMVAGVVLVLRGGGPSWMLLHASSLRYRGLDRAAVKSDTAVLGGGKKPKADDSERRTALLLADLPAGYTVLHDLALPGTSQSVHHVIIGPSGVFVVNSRSYPGVLREDREAGLTHRGVPLAESFGRAAFEQQRIAEELDLKGDQVRALVVIHDAVLPAPSLRIGLYDQTNDLSGEVSVVASGALLAYLQEPSGVLDPLGARRLVRRAQARLVPATSTGVKPKRRRRGAKRPDVVGASVLGADGAPSDAGANEMPPEPFSRSTDVDTLTVVRGQQVAVITDQGLFTDFRVASDERPVNDEGVAMVALCTNEHWLISQRTGTVPEIAMYPLGSLLPD